MEKSITNDVMLANILTMYDFGPVRVGSETDYVKGAFANGVRPIEVARKLVKDRVETFGRCMLS